MRASMLTAHPATDEEPRVECVQIGDVEGDAERGGAIASRGRRCVPRTLRIAVFGLFSGLVFSLVFAAAAPPPARADCVPDSATAQTGDSVICSGATPGGFTAGAGVEDLEILVEAGATIENAAAGEAAIQINTNNPGDDTVTPTIPGVLNAGTIDISGDGSAGIRATGAGGATDFNSVRNDGAINNNATTPGDDVVGIELGDRGVVEHTGTMDLRGERAVGIRVGADGTVTSTGDILQRVSTSGPTLGIGAGDDFIGIDAGDRSQVDRTDGLIEVSTDRSIGIRVGDDGVVNSTAGTIRSIGNGVGVDIIGILAGDRADVLSVGEIRLEGERNIGISVGDDGSVVVRGFVTIGRLPSTRTPGTIGVQIGDGTAGLGVDRGLHVTGTITALGDGSRGAIAGDGWSGGNGRIQIGRTGIVRARGDDAIALLVGDDSRVDVEGTIAGLGLNATGIFMGDQTLGDADKKLVVTGRVVTNFPDAVAVSLGAKAAELGVTLQNSFTPSMELGRLTTDTVVGDAGAIQGVFDSGPLIIFRDETSELNHLLVSDASILVADETNFFDPNRAIVIQGTDGGERIDNYGVIGGKVFLEGGDDIFMVGPTGVLTGNMSVNGGDGLDTLELSDRWGLPIVWTSTDVEIGRFRNFEQAFIRDGPFRVSGRFGAVSPGATIRVDDTGTLIVGQPLQADGAIDFAPGSTLSFQVQRIDAPAFLESGDTVTIETDAPDLLTSTLQVDVSGSIDSGTLTLISGSALNGVFESVEFVPNSYFHFSNLTYDSVGGTLTVDVLADPFSHNRDVTDQYLVDLHSAGASTEIEALIDVLYSLPTEEYLSGLDMLHPEYMDAQTSLQLAMARQFQQSLLERPGFCIAPAKSGRRDPRTKVPCRPHPLDVWTAGYGLFRSRTGAAANLTWEDSGGGGVVGVDHRRGDAWLFSASVGGAKGQTDVDRIGPGDFTALDAGTLVAWTRGPALVQGFLTYGHGWHDVNRNVSIADIALSANGDYDTNRVGAGGELSWTFALDGLDVTPALDIDWALVMRPGFTEQGAGDLSLTVEDANDSVTTLRLGVDVGTSFLKKGYWTDFLERTDGLWQPVLTVKWRQVVSGASRGLSSSMVGAPTGVTGTRVYGDDASQGFEIGAGLWFTPKDATRITFGARYDAFVWKDVVAHDVTGSVSFAF